MKYLGLPLSPHKMRAEDYQLIQSVIYSLVNIWIAVFHSLRNACKNLRVYVQPFYGNELQALLVGQSFLGIRYALRRNVVVLV